MHFVHVSLFSVFVLVFVLSILIMDVEKCKELGKSMGLDGADLLAYVEKKGTEFYEWEKVLLEREWEKEDRAREREPRA